MTAPDAAALHIPDEALTALDYVLDEKGPDQVHAIAGPVLVSYLVDLAVRVRAMAVAAPDDSAAEAYREAARHIAECAERLDDALTAADH